MFIARHHGGTSNQREPTELLTKLFCAIYSFLFITILIAGRIRYLGPSFNVQSFGDLTSLGKNFILVAGGVGCDFNRSAFFLQNLPTLERGILSIFLLIYLILDANHGC